MESISTKGEGDWLGTLGLVGEQPPAFASAWGLTSRCPLGQAWTVTSTSRRPSRWCGPSARAWCRRRRSTSSSTWPSPSSSRPPRRSWRSCRCEQSRGLAGLRGPVGVMGCCWDHRPPTTPLPAVPEGPGIGIREHHLPTSNEERPRQGLPHLLSVSGPCLARLSFPGRFGFKYKLGSYNLYSQVSPECPSTWGLS